MARHSVRAVNVQNEADSGWHRVADGAHGVTRHTRVAWLRSAWRADQLPDFRNARGARGAELVNDY
jgi:hypothetical protein